MPSRIRSPEPRLPPGAHSRAILWQMNNNAGQQQACPVQCESPDDYFPNPIRGKGIHYKGFALKDPHSPPSTLDLSQLEGHSGRERGAALSAEWPGFQKQKSSLRGAAWDAPPD